MSWYMAITHSLGEVVMTAFFLFCTMVYSRILQCFTK